MALALSEFDALCGFCHMEELQAALREVPELAECVGEPHTSALLATREPDVQVCVWERVLDWYQRRRGADGAEGGV